MSKHVLVIEDEPVIRALISASLAGSCEVDSVADGQGALDSVARRLPDLILLDVGLPGMNGTEVLRRLRADKTTADIPVVMLTGLEPPADVEPDAVLLKPFTPSSLRESVAGWLYASAEHRQLTETSS
ncbi:MAG TPA: response regulator [Dehalococcoidia bacterium]|nr:response regulator [Dehalococcoidia bacterium]